MKYSIKIKSSTLGETYFTVEAKDAWTALQRLTSVRNGDMGAALKLSDKIEVEVVRKNL